MSRTVEWVGGPWDGNVFEVSDEWAAIGVEHAEQVHTPLLSDPDATTAVVWTLTLPLHRRTDGSFYVVWRERP